MKKFNILTNLISYFVISALQISSFQTFAQLPGAQLRHNIGIDFKTVDSIIQWMPNEYIVYFKNGDKCKGPLYHPTKYNIGGERDDNVIMFGSDNYNPEYEYWWNNGDYFKGTFRQDENRIGAIIPEQGTMHYADGSKSSWYLFDPLYEIQKYEGTFNRHEHFRKEITPTQLRNLEKETLENAKTVFFQKYRGAFEEEKTATQKQKTQEVATEQRQQTLIQKYGTKWGESLATGKLELGMTQQMCQEVIDIKSYDIGKSMRSGHKVETWTFNKDKQDMQVAAAMTQLSGEEAMALALLMGFADSVGASTPKYSVLVFTDGKLTSLY